jgi:hypothetical protein
MNLSETTLIKRLNKLSPAASEVQLGQLLEDLLVNYNALQAAHVAIVTKYEALLVHLDTANVATFGVAATTAEQIETLSER